MAAESIYDQEAMSALSEKLTENLTDGASAVDMQVKEEPEDVGYEQSSADRNDVGDSGNSSPLPALHFSPSHTNDASPILNQSGTVISQTPQIPLNDLFAGSTIRSKLRGAIAGKKMDTVQNIVESLLKKNETLLAMSDAGGFKPNARRGRPAHDGFVKRTEPDFPPTGQVSVFPVSNALLAHVSTSKRTPDTPKHHLIRPKSPTRRCEGLLKDKTHFTYALMESSAADHEIEKIFKVQNHELVCAIGSKSLLTDKFNKVVASLEFGYFWCNFCPFSTNNKNLLMHHVLEHRFSCKFCAYESFCRSDVVRHMHKMHQDFKHTAYRLSYCTLLSDYLRVKARIDGKENKDPDESVGVVDQEKLDAALLDVSGQKRKSASDSEDAPSPVTKKSRKINEDYIAHSETPGAPSGVPDFDQQENMNRIHVAASETDYDIFDMEVEEINDDQHHFTYNETDKFLYSTNCPSVSTTASDTQPVPTGIVQVVPLTKGSSLQSPVTSLTPNPPAKNVHACRPRSSFSKSYRGGSSSSLYWSCGYCTFQSNSQAEIKDHSNRAHPGKPHRYVALIKNLTLDSGVSKNLRTDAPKASTVSTPARSPNQSLQVQQSYVSMTSPQTSSDSKASCDNDSDETEDVVPLKEKDDSPSLLKVKINSSKAAKKEIVVYKCYHCVYTARRHWTMKSHIYHKHRGMALVAVDDDSTSNQEVFFCARDDCTFRSESASAFLNHVDQCTPWSKPELADVEVEPHIRECLDQTVAIAEMARSKANENTVSNVGLALGDGAEGIGSGKVWIEKRSSHESETKFTWSQGQKTGADDGCNTSPSEDTRNIVDLVYENASTDSISRYCSPQIKDCESFMIMRQNVDKIPSLNEVHENDKSFSRSENQELNACCIDAHNDCSVKKLAEIFVSEKDSDLGYSVSPGDSFIPVGVVDTITREHMHVSEHLPEQGDVYGDTLDEHVKTQLAHYSQVIDESSDYSPVSGANSTNTKFRICEINEDHILSSLEDYAVSGSDSTADSGAVSPCALSNSDSKLGKVSRDKITPVNFIDHTDLASKDRTNASDVAKSDRNTLHMGLKYKTYKSETKPSVDFASDDADKPGRSSLKLKFKLGGQTTVCSISKTDEALSPDDDRRMKSGNSSMSGLSSDSDDSDENYSRVHNQSHCSEAAKIQSDSSDSDQNFNKVSDKSHLSEAAKIQSGSDSSDDDENFNKVSDKSHFSEAAKIQSGSESSDDDENFNKVSDKSHFSEAAKIQSGSDSNDSDEASTQSHCFETAPIEDSKWLKDLLDSSGDSDSNVSSCVPSVHQPESLEVSENPSLCILDKVSVNNVAKNDEVKKFSHMKGVSEICEQKSYFLADAESTESSKSEITKQNYSYVPLRSAAARALSKMKSDSSDKEINKDDDDDDSSFRGRNKKTTFKRKMSRPKLYLSVGHKSRAKKRMLPAPKFRSRISDMYMCQYCVDMSEGSLNKIKAHVLSKHGSMPPVVINCFKQKHRTSCQFYVCPHDACFRLSSALEDFEAHKSTHGTPAGSQKPKEQMCQRKPVSSEKRSSSVIKSTVRSCRVELDQLDVTKLNSLCAVSLAPEEKKYQCLYCTSYYYEKTLLGMKAHYFQEHEGQLIVMRDTEARRSQLPSRIYVCENPNCESFYINRSDLDIHSRSHKSNLTFIYECAGCGWYSASHSAACQHLKSEHADEEAVSLVHTQVSVDEFGQTSKKVL